MYIAFGENFYLPRLLATGVKIGSEMARFSFSEKFSVNSIDLEFSKCVILII